MIELRQTADGKYEKQGLPAYGRVYKVVDLMTGEIGYNCTTSDLPNLDPVAVQQIEQYKTFVEWVTEIISADDAIAKANVLNSQPREFIETPHVLLVKRVRHRLQSGHAGIISYHDVLDDMREMYNDIMGRGQRPSLPGWKD